MARVSKLQNKPVPAPTECGFFSPIAFIASELWLGGGGNTQYHPPVLVQVSNLLTTQRGDTHNTGTLNQSRIETEYKK